VNGQTLAVAYWMTDRQKLIDDIAREIDKVIGARSTGCFVVTMSEPDHGEELDAIQVCGPTGLS